MGREEEAAAWLRKYRLEGAIAVSDPERKLYGAFELRRAPLRTMLRPRVLVRWLLGGVLFRHGAGRPREDAAQMPGVFLLERGRVARAFRHETPADRPDYVAIATGSAP